MCVRRQLARHPPRDRPRSSRDREAAVVIGHGLVAVALGCLALLNAGSNGGLALLGVVLLLIGFQLLLERW
jgi:hypothetical protein